MGLVQGSGSIHATSPAEAAPEPRVAVTARGVLVERAQAGDQAAFEALLERWLGPSLRTAFAILGNEPDARDATQDAFLQAWRELRRLRDPDRFDAWLNRILVNRCRTLRGSRRRTTVREINLSALLLMAPSGSPVAGTLRATTGTLGRGWAATCRWAPGVSRGRRTGPPGSRSAPTSRARS